ncbi:hypothetical protein JHK85_003284 [Glycine max]|nr:hypothetical protein JHK85_003284 [Glycine max]
MARSNLLTPGKSMKKRLEWYDPTVTPERKGRSRKERSRGGPPRIARIPRVKRKLDQRPRRVRHPRATLFSLVVAVITSVLIGILLAIVLMILRNEYPSLFSNDTEGQDLVKNLTPFLCFCIVINNVQPVLSGVAIGAGWQALVAYVNIACYYLFGIPVGLVLGYKLDWGVKGIWLGMIAGTILQTCVLLVLIYKTNWNEEASLAEDRIRTWGGHEKATVKDTKNTKEET